MSRRWLVPSVLACVCCLEGQAVSASKRPVGTGTGPVAAEVFRVKGPATVRAAGRTFPAVPGLPLFRGDEIAAPTGGYLLVRLTNGYLARVDEEISLAVGELALIDARPCREDPETQLGRLLSQAERDLSGQRVVGYRAGMRGADSTAAPAATPELPPMARRAEEKVSRKESSAKRMDEQETSIPRATLAEPEVDGVSARAKQKAVNDDFGGAVSPEKGSAPAAVGGASAGFPEEVGGQASAPTLRWWLLDAGRESLQPGPAPDFVLLVQGDRSLFDCLVLERRRLGLAVQGPLKLLARIDSGEVVAVRPAGGLATPDCLSVLVGAKAPEVEGRRWVAFEVYAP